MIAKGMNLIHLRPFIGSVYSYRKLYHDLARRIWGDHIHGTFEVLYSFLKFVRIQKIDISEEYVYDHHTYDTIVES